MITLQEARRFLTLGLPEPGSEWAPLDEALGRVVASDLVAPCPLPAESRSRLDGYAIASGDTRHASEDRPARCRLAPWSVTAGRAPTEGIEAGWCARVMTGAVIPRGADAVVALERTRTVGDHLLIAHPVEPLSGVVREGSDALQGEVLAVAGEVLTPTKLAMVAAYGFHRLEVARQPRVALLSTGDEVREPGEALSAGGIYSNHRHLLGWLTRLNGGVAVHLGVSGDDPARMAESLERVDADVYVTTGGTGRGDRDYASEVWRGLGVQEVFKGVLVSPGKGAMAGFRDGRLYLALPGSPWGGRIIFEELLRPFLWGFQGLSRRWPLTVKALLGEPVTHGGGICRVVAGVLDMTQPTLSFLPLHGKGETVLQEARRSIAYILLEPHVLEMAAGSEVDARLFDLPLLAVALLGSPPTAGD